MRTNQIDSLLTLDPSSLDVINNEPFVDEMFFIDNFSNPCLVWQSKYLYFEQEESGHIYDLEQQKEIEDFQFIQDQTDQITDVLFKESDRHVIYAIILKSGKELILARKSL